MSCFECGHSKTENHHVVPVSKGGTKTVKLCVSCHGKVHNAGWRRDNLADLIREGRKKKGLPVVELTKEQELEMCFAYKAGDSMEQIAIEFGICKSTVNHRLRKHKIPVRTRKVRV